MTVYECYETAVGFIPELPEDNVEMQRHMVNWCNVLLADALNYENIYRRKNKMEQLVKPEKVADNDDEIPYNETLVATAFPYGMARFVFRENDDIAGSHEYYQLYLNALTEATPLEIIEVEDVY